MDGRLGKPLRILNDAPCSGIVESSRAHDEQQFAGPHEVSGLAEELYAWESLTPSKPSPVQEPPAEPFTLQWFLRIENQRLGRHGRWIPRLLEFTKHPGETLLGLGSGLGTDWLQYARHGASVVICSPSKEQLALIRRNFHLRGLDGRFLHATPECLPLEASSVDVACVSGLLEEAAQPAAVAFELYRVLKPGGKVLAVTRARYDVDFWYRVCFPWQRLRRARGSRFERPLTAFSARSLRRLFGQLTDHRIRKRHLVRCDVPHVWRWVPRPLLERAMGRVLVLKAFKPLSAAIALQAAA